MRINRRRLSNGFAVSTVASFLKSPGSFAQTPSPVAETWSFTDFRGESASLPSTPTRVVAQTTSAASLKDFGIEVAGFFGPNDYGTDFEFSQVGDMAVPQIEHIGDWGELDIEKLISLDAELYIDLFRGGDALWYLADVETENLVREVCPTIGVNANGVPFMETLQEFERLAIALGADESGPDLVDGKAALADAEEAFRTSIEGKQDMKVVAISLNGDGSAVLWNSNWLSDLQYMQDLGMTAVDVGAGDDVPNIQVSIEQLGEYPADVYLVDSRESLDAYDAIPLWKTLPAVKAGQVGWWYSSVLFSYKSLAKVLHLNSETLAKSQPVT